MPIHMYISACVCVFYIYNTNFYTHKYTLYSIGTSYENHCDYWGVFNFYEHVQ